MSRWLFAIVPTAATVFAVSGCATQPAGPRRTPLPVASYTGKTPEQVLGRALSHCAARGWMIVESNSSQVVCARRQTGLAGAFYESLVVGSYGSMPEVRIRITAYGDDSKTNANAQAWVQAVNAFGKPDINPLNSAKWYGDLQQFLNSLGADVR